MKVCPECARSYSDEAVVCAFDGSPLSAGSTGSWEGKRGAEPVVGDVLGQYRILGKLAQGGMGVIYKAQHVRLGRHVALKVLKTDLVRRSDVVQRFFSEARAVNEIGHPSIVDIIDFVEVVDADPPLVYMVMELLTGQDLGRRIREKGPLDPSLAAAIADRIADALTATHRVQILHRDLKPENVYLLDSEDGTLKVKLLDFGVAKAFGERKRQDMTDPGSAVGTPAYMAPEQVLELELDERTDIYALGLLLYEMLTGSVPFHAASYGEVLIKQVKERPELIRRRRASGTPVPPALERIVMTCLEKEPARRFQTMGQVRAALASAVPLDHPVVAPALSTVAAAPFPAPRRGGRSLVVIAGALLAAGVTIGIWILLSPSRPQADTRAPDGGAATARPPDARATPIAAPIAGEPDAGARADLATRRPPKRGRPSLKPGEKSEERPLPKTKSRESTVDPFAL